MICTAMYDVLYIGRIGSGTLVLVAGICSTNFSLFI